MTNKGRSRIVEYEFEVVSRARIPEDKPTPQTTYWQRFLKAVDLLEGSEALFVRSDRAEPTGEDVSRLRNLIRTQLKRFRPPSAGWDIVRALDDGGVYIAKVESSEERPHFVLPDLENERNTPTLWASQDERPDLEHDPTGPEPQGIIEEEEDAYALRFQGESVAKLAQAGEETPDNPGFVEGPPTAFATIERAVEEAKVVAVDNDSFTLSVDLKGVVCNCPQWWQAAAQFKRIGPALRGPHHHEKCPFFSTWENSPSLEPCSCRPAYIALQPKRGRDDYFAPGDWHQAKCPRHVHRWILPAADKHEPGTPFVGVCACGATKDNQPYQESGSSLLVAGAKKGAAPLPAPVAQPKNDSRYCPDCGGAWSSTTHKQCKAAKDAAKEEQNGD